MRARLDPVALGQFVRYVVVGAVQNGLYLGVFAAEVAGGIGYLIASLAAAIMAVLAGFALNRRWTFRALEDPPPAPAVRYLAIWATFALGSLAPLALLVRVGHLEPVLAQAIVISLAAPLSYAAQRRFAFSRRR